MLLSYYTLNRIQKVLAIFLKNIRLTVATFLVSLLFGASSYYGFASVMAGRHIPIDRLTHLSIYLKKNEKKQTPPANIKFINGLRWLNGLNKNIELLPIIVSSSKNIKQKNTPQIKIKKDDERHNNNEKLALVKYKKEKKKVKKIRRSKKIYKKITVLSESKKAQRKIVKKKKIKKISYIDQSLERSLGINLVQ